MPLFTWRCYQCGKKVQRIMAAQQAAQGLQCPDDRTLLVRMACAPTSQVKEVVDNGLMAKRVELIKK